MKSFIQTFILVLLFSPVQSLGQNKLQVERVLKQVTTFSEIDSLQKVHSKWEIYGETLSALDIENFPFLKNPILGEIYKHEIEKRNHQNYLVKILEKETQHLCRVQYIFLDGEKLKMKEIDSIRTEIHRRVNRGEKFHEMIEHYTMDGGSGDIGWFSKEMVVSEFYDPILGKAKGDVFDISIPKNKWYYVVHKTHEDIIRNYFYTIWMGYN